MMRGYLGPFSLPPHPPPFVNSFVKFFLSSLFRLFFRSERVFGSERMFG